MTRSVLRSSPNSDAAALLSVLEGDGSGGDRVNFIQRIKLDPVTMADVKVCCCMHEALYNMVTVLF